MRVHKRDIKRLCTLAEEITGCYQPDDRRVTLHWIALMQKELLKLLKEHRKAHGENMKL
jgi:hypothetical protein